MFFKTCSSGLAARWSREVLSLFKLDFDGGAREGQASGSWVLWAADPESGLDADGQPRWEYVEARSCRLREELNDKPRSMLSFLLLNRGF